MRALQSSLLWLLCLSSFCAGSTQDYQVKTLATGLDEPWSIAPIGGGTYLVTEKSGRLVRLEPNGSITPITGTPPVYFASQGGLLEVLADTDFANNRMIYLSFAGGDKSANRTTVVKAKLDGDKLREIQTNKFGIGSPTRTHPHMHMITPEQVEEELRISNDRFIAELGIRPDLFAYPYGEYNLTVIEAVKKAGFIAAFGQNSGIMNGYDGYYELPRFAMNEQYGTLDRLELAINGLPLKVRHVTPADVVLDENPPIYGFTMAPEMDAPKQLRCFNSIFGKLDVTTLSHRAEIRLPGPLTGKRARINCTMPGPDGRWRWYGRQFLLPNNQ